MSYTLRALRPMAAFDGRLTPSVVSSRQAACWQLVVERHVLGCGYPQHREAVPV